MHFDLRSEDETAVPLLRSDEAQLIARELLYLALDLDAENADTVDAAPLIEWILAAAAARRPTRSTAAVEELEEQLGPLPGFAALADQLASGFLLCAVLDDVTRRRVIKFAYDEPLARPGSRRRTSTTPRAAPRRRAITPRSRSRTRCGRARPSMIDNRTGAVLAIGPRDADRPAIHYVADAGTRLEPGLSVRYGTERGRFLVPAALRGVGDRARADARRGCSPTCRRWPTSGGPAIAVLLSSSALFSGLVLRSGEHPLVRLDARALPAVPGRGDRGGGRRRRRRSRSGPPAGRWRWTWGIGALVAVLSAGILSVEAARAPAAAKDR